MNNYSTYQLTIQLILKVNIVLVEIKVGDKGKYMMTHCSESTASR